MLAERFGAILLFGAPGVGKGTQGAILGRIPGYVHLSSGELFRSLDPKSPNGRIVADYLARGELVPDGLTVKLWKSELDKKADAGDVVAGRDLLLLDGIPRNASQSQQISDCVEVLSVIYLAATDEEAMIERIRRRALTENRIDDADEQVIRHRFQVFHEESKKVLDYFPDEVCSCVEAMGTPAEVLREILNVIIPVQNAYLSRTNGG